jgi:hypothetical protein
MSGWNGSGIGSNDTGGGRDKQKPSGFDKRFPIDITISKLGLLLPGPATPRQLYIRIKNMAPYTIRMSPTNLLQHADLQNSETQIENSDASILEAMRILLGALPAGWSVQVNPVRSLIQRDFQIPANAVINPEQWPPAEWLQGEDRCVVFRSV